MSSYNAPFEIHVHGQVQMRADTTFEQLQDALKPLWKYAGARSLADGAASAYEEEPGIEFDAKEHVLNICWTVHGDEDFRQSLDEMCMSLNELSEQGAAIEVTFYDTEFDEDEEDDGTEARDDFVMLFVGPTPAAIMQVQRDLLVQDVVHLMERHFDGAELGGVVSEIDKLFSQRFDALVNSLEIGKPPRGTGAAPVPAATAAAVAGGPATCIERPAVRRRSVAALPARLSRAAARAGRSPRGRRRAWRAAAAALPPGPCGA